MRDFKMVSTWCFQLQGNTVRMQILQRKDGRCVYERIDSPDHHLSERAEFGCHDLAMARVEGHKQALWRDGYELTSYVARPC